MRRIHRLIMFLVMATAITGCQSLREPEIDDLPPTAATPASSEAGIVYVRYYDGISGPSLDSLTSAGMFPAEPTETGSLTQLASLTKRGDDYGAFVRGYIIPPADGEYEFFLAADDETTFSLSTDISADNLSQIAHVPTYSGQQVYDRYASQRSGLIRLQANTRYYFELLHKQGVGSDHYSVAWTGPNLTQQIVSGEYLASWAPSSYDETGNMAEGYKLGYQVGFFDGEKGLAFSPEYPPLDNDQDGLYDNWETFYGLNPNDSSDAAQDSDGDLLTAQEEFSLGTNPSNPDTSGDGLTDGEKYAYGLDPLDPNDIYTEIDGETVNLYEYLHGSQEVAALELLDGFIGHYFIGSGFEEFALSRVDSEISFDWGGGSPDPSIPNNRFSVRWFTQVIPPHESGSMSYRLNIRGDDGLRVWLGSDQVIDAWTGQSATTYSSIVELDVQQAPYPLIVEYYEGYGSAEVEFWLSNPQTGEIYQGPGIFNRPSLDLNEQTALVDSDADGIPDVWELSYGLNPWEDDAGTVHNSQDLTSLEAYEMGVHPWTLEDVSEPVEVTPPTTTSPDAGSGQITLSWTAPGTRTDGSSISLSEIDHYRVDYGQQIEDLSQTVDVEAGTTSYTFDGLATGTWYFQVYVVDTDGLVSPGSEVVSGEVQ